MSEDAEAKVMISTKAIFENIFGLALKPIDGRNF